MIIEQIHDTEKQLIYIYISYKTRSIEERVKVRLFVKRTKTKWCIFFPFWSRACNLHHRLRAIRSFYRAETGSERVCSWTDTFKSGVYWIRPIRLIRWISLRTMYPHYGGTPRHHSSGSGRDQTGEYNINGRVGATRKKKLSNRASRWNPFARLVHYFQEENVGFLDGWEPNTRSMKTTDSIIPRGE